MSKRIHFILVVLALAWRTMADVQAKSKKEGRFSGQTAKQVASQMWLPSRNCIATALTEQTH